MAWVFVVICNEDAPRAGMRTQEWIPALKSRVWMTSDEEVCMTDNSTIRRQVARRAYDGLIHVCGIWTIKVFKIPQVYPWKGISSYSVTVTINYSECDTARCVFLCTINTVVTTRISLSLRWGHYGCLWQVERAVWGLIHGFGLRAGEDCDGYYKGGTCVGYMT